MGLLDREPVYTLSVTTEESDSKQHKVNYDNRVVEGIKKKRKQSEKKKAKNTGKKPRKKKK